MLEFELRDLEGKLGGPHILTGGFGPHLGGVVFLRGKHLLLPESFCPIEFSGRHPGGGGGPGRTCGGGVAGGLGGPYPRLGLRLRAGVEKIHVAGLEHSENRFPRDDFRARFPFDASQLACHRCRHHVTIFYPGHALLIDRDHERPAFHRARFHRHGARPEPGDDQGDEDRSAQPRQPPAPAGGSGFFGGGRGRGGGFHEGGRNRGSGRIAWRVRDGGNGFNRAPSTH